MHKYMILGFTLILVLALVPGIYAGKVELTTYYPAPSGEYQSLNSTEGSNFATASGNVGIGTTSPNAKLDVAGEIKVGNSQVGCSSTNEGAQRYNAADKVYEFCNGADWVRFGGLSFARMNSIGMTGGGSVTNLGNDCKLILITSTSTSAVVSKTGTGYSAALYNVHNSGFNGPLTTIYQPALFGNTNDDSLMQLAMTASGEVFMAQGHEAGSTWVCLK